MKTYELRSPEDIAALAEEWGFLPFFAGEIPGFSVEECCPPELFGYDFVTSAYGREQEELRARIIAHLESILPGVNEKQILKLIG